MSLGTESPFIRRLKRNKQVLKSLECGFFWMVIKFTPLQDCGLLFFWFKVIFGLLRGYKINHVLFVVTPLSSF